MSFAYDLLLFARGNTMSVELMMQAFKGFSNSTGMNVNPSKYKVYFGNVESTIKQNIKQVTEFTEGPLPFRYLSISLNSKKLPVEKCLILVDKIVNRIKHCSAKILSFAGRLQLINSVLFSTTNYWLQYFPLPQTVMKKVEAACGSFLWSNSDKVTRKSLIALSKVFLPKKQGGLNIISITGWNKACLTKLLWNLCGKADSLWIKWIHSYYTKHQDIMTVLIKTKCSWILKVILNQRHAVCHLDEWKDMLLQEKACTRKIYYAIKTQY
ncbi:uncharacterized protein LOC127130420 [Lathyrus oleraceus]|uniref:uncharacterized protein LOC127130420 n=1 Tax=Pisum sativum TaxID=3888 RepID=UPI0021CFBCB2|nr:uncharacterized protein LOC127130420 [Pisum sativum]